MKINVEERISDIRRQIRAYMDTHDLSQEQMSKIIGLKNRTVLSKFLNHKINSPLQDNGLLGVGASANHRQPARCRAALDLTLNLEP